MGAPKGGGPEGWEPRRWGAEGGRPKVLRFFFPSPTPFSLFLSFSGGLPVKFWWCLKRRGAQMCTFGVLGLSCEAPAAPKLGMWKSTRSCCAGSQQFQTSNQHSVLPPDSVAPFAAAHDEGLWQCFCRLLDISPDQHHVTRTMTTLPVALGGLGLRSARRTSRAAYWASWADCLQMIQERQPELAAQVELSLEEGVDTPALHAAASCAIELIGVMGFAPPSWSNLALGARPPPREAEDLEPGAQRRGWQHEASSRVERRHRSVILFPQLTEADKALTRSQSGTGAGVALTTTPSNLLTRIEPQLFRVLLLRRLRLPLPLSRRFCRCGRLLDSLGHHRAACSRVGVLGRRGFALESAVAKICREASGKVATNLFVRDLDVNVPNLMDDRRFEVVADGLPLFAGAQPPPFEPPPFEPPPFEPPPFSTHPRQLKTNKKN